MRSQTRFIFFDMGKVLLDFDHARINQQVGKLAGIEPAIIKSLLFEPPFDLENRFERGELNADEFHSEFCSRAETQVQKQALLRAVSEIFWLNVSIMPILSQLRSINFPMAVLSNTCSAHWEYARETFACMGLFRDAVLSYEEKSMKPDPVIYQSAIKLAQERTGCDIDQIFFTDDRQENVDAAKEAGIDAELFTDSRTLLKFMVQRGIPVG